MTRPAPTPTIRHHHPETPDLRALAAARAYLLSLPAPQARDEQATAKTRPA